MTDALFLAEDSARDGRPLPGPGETFELTGSEGRHAATVKRIRVGESVIIADGLGAAVRGQVIGTGKDMISVQVSHTLTSNERAGRPRITVAQALAKGERSELAVEMLTEIGVDEIWPWQSDRSIVRWSGERGERSLGKWRSTAREATKQSRRFRIPVIGAPTSTAALASKINSFDLALVLHEDAEASLDRLPIGAVSSLLIMVGPEGGISPEETDRLQSAGGRLVSVSDGVLRTSTAGVVAVAGVLLR